MEEQTKETVAPDETWIASHFDPNDHERLQDPYPVYDYLRAKCPVAHSDAHEDGFWVLSRYEDVRAALTDFRRFASGPSVSLPARELPIYPVESNPPRHTFLRRLVNEPFSPQAVRGYEPQMRADVVELIERVISKDECDLVAELAFPVPVRALFRSPLFGDPLPLDDADADWIHVMHTWVREQKHSPEKSVEAGEKISFYLERLLEDRTDNPQDDIPTMLSAALRNDDDLARDEALGILAGLFTGGIETPANAISLILLYLAQHPEAKEQLRADHELVPTAIEELLRYYGPSQGVRRTVTEDVVVDGKTLKKGDPVWIALNAADRDEQEFEAAHEIKLDRSPNRHVGFGLGPHRCIGLHFSRLMLRVVVEEWVDRAPNLEIRSPEGLRWWMSTSRVLDSLPVTFERVLAESR